MLRWTNFAVTTLNNGGSVNNSSDPVTFVVTSASKFPTAGNFYVRIDDEVMLVTSVSGTSFTATRAQLGTSIATHTDGSTVSGVVTSQLLDWNRRSALYLPFVPSGVDDEFDDESFSGWTAVNDGTAAPTITEINDRCSILLPGGTTAQHLYAYMKSATINVGDYVEAVADWSTYNTGYPQIGVIMADGATYNSGTQVVVRISPQEGVVVLSNFTGYNTAVGGVFVTGSDSQSFGRCFMRLTYVAANTWRCSTSPDGVNWIRNADPNDRTVTMTPTHLGFFVMGWGSDKASAMSFHYVRKGP